MAGLTDTWVRLSEQNFTSIGAGGGNAAPKYQKFPLFGRVAYRSGEPLNRFLIFLEAFIRPTILHQCFKFDVIRFTGYGVIAEKPCVGQFGRIFPCGAKICCLSLCFFVLSFSEAGALFVRGDSSNEYCVMVYGSTLMWFPLFLGGLPKVDLII